MIDQKSVERLYECDVIDARGDRIGSVKQVWLDEQSGEPVWASVHTGIFGMRESFVPIQGAKVSDKHITVPVEKQKVKDAPEVDASGGRLSDAEQANLYEYYGMPTPASGDHDRLDGDRASAAGRDRSAGRRDEQSMVRSEEHLKVGTEQVETGRVRLVKHTVTEQQNVTVPVSHEEVRVVREPVTSADAGTRDKAFRAEESEVVLHEERPVVDKETVAVERVGLGKETVTEQRTVAGEVRKERVDVVDDTERARDDRRR
ncbi:PRC and DUF2382 domain-containing protein [Umezawaea sp.]|uniref:PRC and DUF2382 domain-containing protein n=1 Tax=Umezawaea sp. TaxID=1955258 RepID=UPI002ED271BF